MNENQIQQKIFESTDFGEIRVFEQNGEAWFVGRDVCKAFGDKNSSRALSRVDDEDKQIITITDSMGITQNVTIINESGLYSVFFAQLGKDDFDNLDDLDEEGEHE
jgi:anti-repressor protein